MSNSPRWQEGMEVADMSKSMPWQISKHNISFLIRKACRDVILLVLKL